ncbi:Mitochondrial 2-oxodicarboxylate carrier [Lamellibrachia satsuma]|nr:Mitochondrial 2-oxodicarboxylate carrier [Lamellibrachia satsuma]
MGAVKTPSVTGNAKHRPYALATLQMISGGCAGFVEVCVTQPLDVVQSRLQLQRGTSRPGHYATLTDVFKNMYKIEGPLSFYKGIVSRLMSDTPKQSIKFFTFEQFKRFFSVGDKSATPLGLTLSGLSSGILEGLISNPFEMVNVQSHADRQQLKQHVSSFVTAKRMFKTGGFGSSSINCALTSSLLRHGIFNMVYFGFYHNVKNMNSIKSEHATFDFLRRFVIGFAAGVLGSILNNPFDVAKVRIQCQLPVAGQVKYNGCFRTIRMMYTEEGFRSLYRGFLPKVLILGPGSAIMMVTYESVYESLQTWL